MTRAATLRDLIGQPVDISAHALAVLTAVDHLGHRLQSEIAKPDPYTGNAYAQQLTANIIDLAAVASALVRGAAEDAEAAAIGARGAPQPVPNTK